MEDNQIIELYWLRNEEAIKETQAKYGSYCGKIAENILNSKEDAEECLNDTWNRAWNMIPPEKPKHLTLFLGKITRNLAIDRYRRDKSQKNGGGQITMCLEELEECIGDDGGIEERIAIRDLINTFLKGLSKKNRDIFLYRYWYMMPVERIAEKYAASEGAIKMNLLRTRKSLREYLEKEGVSL